MASDFPFLDSLADEIHKMHFETEERAKAVIQKDLPKLREEQALAFKLVDQRMAAHSNAIQGMTQGLTKVIDKLSNSGAVVRPTDGQQNSDDNSKT